MAAIQRARSKEQLPAVDAQDSEFLPSERVMAAGYLPRVLTTTDLSMIFIAVILFIANAAVVPGAGAAAFIYWGLGFVTFLIPCAIVVAELGRAFPGEGSIYLWSTKVFGTFWGFFSGFCHWFPGILVMVSTADVVVSILQLLNPDWLQEPWQQGIAILFVLIVSFFLALLPLRSVQTLVNVVVGAYLIAILLVGAAGLMWVLNGHPPQQDFSSASWQIKPASWPYYGTVILALLGVELPITLGAEVREHQSIMRHLRWGAVGVVLAYLIGTFGVMMVVPSSEIGNPGAVPDAVKMVFGGTVGGIVSLVMLVFFVCNTALYNYLFARMLLVASLDHRLPSKLAVLNNARQPWIAMLWQTIIAALFAFAAFIVVPYVFLQSSSPTGRAALSSEVYNVLQAAVTVVWCVAMLFLFLAVAFVHRKLVAQNRLGVARTSPLLLGVCMVVGLIASLTGIWTTLTGSWVPNFITSDRWIYIVVVACFIGLDLGLLLTFFLTGRPALDPIKTNAPPLELPASSLRPLPPVVSRSMTNLGPQGVSSSSQPRYSHAPSPSQPLYPPFHTPYPPDRRSRSGPT